MMGRLYEMVLASLLIVLLLNTEFTRAKRGGGGGSRGKGTLGSKTQSKPPGSQPGNYPRQPQSPNRNTNPYPSGGSYPFPKQNQPSYPGAGSNPNQYPGRVNPGGYPNQNPPVGGYPNQNPGRGNYPNQYPPAGGYPNQYPGRAGTNPGGYPNQYPAGGGYPNQYPAGGGYPNQYPAGGGYPNQYPVGYPRYPNQYPAGGGYPVQGRNTGPGWGVPGAKPGGYPAGYPNWNPNNKILSPRYGGGYGYGGYGMGGSPFSHSVQGMGLKPASPGFAKKAMVAAGVGALAGMAVGYGLGRFPRPHFSFRSPQEEYYYNNYMYREYGSRSTDKEDFGRDYVYMPPPRAETYESFMSRCMNRTDAPRDKGSSTSKSGAKEEDDDTVSIEEIGYPALIEQVKSRRCIEEYMDYSAKFLKERKAEQQFQPNRCSPLSYGVIQLFTSFLVLLSSMFLLQ